jgi:cystathionine beta-synthase
MWYNNILETIGDTPLVKLNKVTKDIPATVLAKIETTNPAILSKTVWRLK